LLFDGKSLHWDADFSLAELGSFATRVVTNEERLEAPRSPFA
jgi:hypothetical protein